MKKFTSKLELSGNGITELNDDQLLETNGGYDFIDFLCELFFGGELPCCP